MLALIGYKLGTFFYAAVLMSDCIYCVVWVMSKISLSVVVIRGGGTVGV